MTAETSVRPSVHFALHYRDVDAALRWLDAVLGLRAEWRYPTSAPAQHAGMRWGNGGFSINYKRGIYELGPSSAILAVDTDAELDVLYSRVIDAGAQVARPLGRNWDQRSRNFVVRDPEGNLWELSGPDAE